MIRKTMLAFTLAALLAAPAGCQNSRTAAKEAQTVGQETRRYEGIKDYSTPEEAKASMGREPDAIQHDGELEIHYYLVRGAVNGEALRLVYKKGRLVNRSVVQVETGR